MTTAFNPEFLPKAAGKGVSGLSFEPGALTRKGAAGKSAVVEPVKLG